MPSEAEVRASQMLIATVKKVYPKARDEFKGEHFGSKAIGHLVAPFNPNYARFTTTKSGGLIRWAQHLKQRVLDHEWRVFKTRAHEGQHIWDWKEHPILFPLLYASPHIFAVVFLGLFAGFGKLWGLASLGVLVGGMGLGYILPKKKWWFFLWTVLAVGSCVALGVWKVKWPSLWMVGAGICASPLLNWLGLAYGRAWAEFRGYAITLAINYWKHGSVLPSTIKRIAKHFTRGNYFFMLPWKRYVLKRLNRSVLDAGTGALIESNPWAKKVYGIMLQCGLIHDDVLRQIRAHVKTTN